MIKMNELATEEQNPYPEYKEYYWNGRVYYIETNSARSSTLCPDGRKDKDGKNKSS